MHTAGGWSSPATRRHASCLFVAVTLVCTATIFSVPSAFAGPPPQCPNGTDGNGNSACIVPNGTTIQQYTNGTYSGITEVDPGGEIQVANTSHGQGELHGGDTATNNGKIQLEGPTSFPTVINNATWQISTGGSTTATGSVTNTGTFQLNNAGSLSAGTISINAGSLQGTGSGTSVSATNNIIVGGTGSGTATMQIIGAASAQSSSGIVGDVAGSNATANIDGTNTKWTFNHQLSVGNSGTGTLTITNGATVSDFPPGIQ